MKSKTNFTTAIKFTSANTGLFNSLTTPDFLGTAILVTNQDTDNGSLKR